MESTQGSTTIGGDAARALQLLEPVYATLRRVEGIPVQVYEELDGDELRPLRDLTRDALRVAIEAIDQLLAHYDAIADQRTSSLNIETTAPLPGEFCHDVERMMTQEMGTQRVQNVGFVARMGLRDSLSILDGLGPTPGKWALIETASSSLRQIRKALGALALGVCSLEDLPVPSTFYVTELSSSLIVRRAYSIFYAEIDPSREPEPATIRARLRHAANVIAKLCGRPIYASMRIQDRFSLRSIQERLHEWLSSKSFDARSHEAMGQRLFQDLAHITELMLSVNDRAELRVHDAQVISSVADALESGTLDLTGAFELLVAVRGRDPKLDAMISREQPVSTGQLVERLRDLGRRLTPRRSSIPPPRPAVPSLIGDDDFL